ncbi:MAG: class I SAM-dependent methyltransferase [bacterium]
MILLPNCPNIKIPINKVKAILIIKSARNTQIKNAISKLRNIYPKAKLYLLASNKFKEEFKECEIISYPDKKKLHPLWLGKKTWKYIRNLRLDMTVICYNHSTEWGPTYLWVEIIALFSKARWIAQFWKKETNNYLNRFKLTLFLLIKFKYWIVNQYYKFKALREISQYTGENIKIVSKKIKESAKNAVDSWEENLPKTDKEIKDWYSKTDIYIYQLMRRCGYYPGSRLEWLSEILRYCQGKKVLDYGCGVGHLGIELIKHGFEVTNADVPGRTFNFVKWRYQKKGLLTKFVELNDKFSLSETYDVILCTDVLEHIPNPIDTLRLLSKHLKGDGILLIKMGEEENEECPLHLDAINKSNYFSIMEELGFQQITKESSEDMWKLLAWKKKAE